MKMTIQQAHMLHEYDNVNNSFTWVNNNESGGFIFHLMLVGIIFLREGMGLSHGGPFVF